MQVGRWGQFLTIPEKGYLEGPGGPVPLRSVVWIEVSTTCVRGGMAGRPRQMIDVKGEILAGLQETQLNWEIYDSVWSVEGIFEEEPVQMLRIKNPFGPVSMS